MPALSHALVVATLLLAAPKPAAPPAATALPAFEQKAFDAGLKAGTPMVVIVAATWCPVCKAQENILGRLRGTPELRDVKVFRVDFDAQGDAVKLFRADSQSTILAFKAGKEVGRWVGETKEDRIAIMMKRTLPDAAPAP